MPFLLVCLVGLLIAVHANPVSPPMVAGQVRLSDGSPVVGAQVMLFDVADLRRGAVGQATTDEAGQFALPLAAGGASIRPQEIALGQNYPNPFNPSTIIPYQLASPSLVRLEVFNILGQRVATLVDGPQEAGVYRARWDGTDASGGAAAAGVYIYRLTVDGVHWTGKMVLLDGQAGVPLGGTGVEAVSLAEGSSPSYGLVVSGAGFVPYVDADFGIAAGQGPIAIELTTPQGRGKVVATLEGMLGDVNTDGRVDMDDGLLVAMYSVDPAVLLPHHGLMTLGDVNCDGRVELGDAALLATYVVHPSDPAVSSLRIGQRGGYSLDPVTEMVWGSILGTDKKDPTVARLLDEVPVLLSGVMPIDGEDRLYLGIDQAWWDEHGGEHIYEALQERFPATPLHVEPSIGVVQPPRTRLPAGKPTSQTQEAEDPAHILLETFEEGLGAWRATQWTAAALDSEATVPGETAGNIVAQARGCPFCFLTLTEPVDLSAYDEVTFSFYRWLDPGMDDNEFLGIDIGNNGAYQRLDNWGKQDADGQWHRETYTLTKDQISDAFSLRFFAITTNAFTTVALDNVVIAAAPGSIVVEPVEPEEEPEEEPEQPEEPEEEEEEPGTLDDFFNFFDDDELTLTVTNMFAFPRSVKEGSTIFVGARITNTGDDEITSQTVSVYRHTSETQNPTTGGTRETATTTISTLAPDTSRNVSVRVTAPATAATTQYHYYICISAICADTPVTITVQPDPDQPEQEEPEEEEEEPTTRPDLSVSNTTAQPISLQSDDTLTISAIITNTGTAAAPSKTVTIYRHTRATNNPQRGGVRERNTTTTGSLAPNTAISVTSTHTAPTVAATTRYYYYVCVENTCSSVPAEVVIRTKPEDPGPPYKDCYHVPERSTPMGGDSLLTQPVGDTTAATCGTITLGGLETATGVPGFVISAHAVADISVQAGTSADYTRTDVLIAHSEHKSSLRMKHFLGKVFRMPAIYTEEGRKTLSADAAFVAYPSPKTPGCSLTWTSDSEEFCLDPNQDEHIERVVPLSIRGENNRVYTVVGSEEPTDGLATRISGAVTGVPLKGTVTGGRLLQVYDYGEDFYAIYAYVSAGDSVRGGDSGSPVYTVPDSAGNVRILGVLYGRGWIGGEDMNIFGSWNDVTQGLGLKPIGE